MRLVLVVALLGALVLAAGAAAAARSDVFAMRAAGVTVEWTWEHLPHSKKTLVCVRVTNATKEFFSHPDATLATPRLRKGEARTKALGPILPQHSAVARWTLNLVAGPSALVHIAVSTKVGDGSTIFRVRSDDDADPFAC